MHAHAKQARIEGTTAMATEIKHYGFVGAAGYRCWFGECACGWTGTVRKDNRAAARAEMVEHVQSHA